MALALLPSRQTIDKSNRFLCQRDGIDKVMRLQYSYPLASCFCHRTLGSLSKRR